MMMDTTTVVLAKGNKEHLLQTLRDLAVCDDPEEDHIAADAALLGYIGDEGVIAAFNAIEKWYA